jgi:7-carboxy-7-deazaguanine synthase
MIILRLMGCTVGCPWCDTKYTWQADPAQQVAGPDAAEALGPTPAWWWWTPRQTVDYIAARWSVWPEWVLLTGGEPAEQELKPLVDELHRAGYEVALETYGTALGHLHADCDWVCVSPKLGMAGGKPLQPAALATADELKFVVGKEADIQTLEALLYEYRHVFKEGMDVCVQPVSLLPKATQLALSAALSHGWRLSIQTHRYLNLP